MMLAKPMARYAVPMLITRPMMVHQRPMDT